MPRYTYKIYHTTTKKKAAAIMVNGFKPRKKSVELSNSPWMIGTKGDTVIEVTIDLDYDPNTVLPEVSFLPDTLERGHVQLTHARLNECRDTFRIVPDEEKNELRRKFKTPGSPTLVDRDDEDD